MKNNLSRYIRRVEAGERFAVTEHGRIVAELVPPLVPTGPLLQSQYAELVTSGAARPPAEDGDPLADWPAIRLKPGTAAKLIAEDRGDR